MHTSAVAAGVTSAGLSSSSDEAHPMSSCRMMPTFGFLYLRRWLTRGHLRAIAEPLSGGAVRGPSPIQSPTLKRALSHVGSTSSSA